MNDYINKYLKPPAVLINKAKPHLEKLSELFGTLEVKDIDSQKQTSDTLKDSEKVSNSENVKNVSNKTTQSALTDNLMDFFNPDDMDLKMEDVSFPQKIDKTLFKSYLLLFFFFQFDDF